MSPDETLLTLAELAVAFMGFSGIISVFRNQRSWSQYDAIRLWSMLRFAAALLLFSLLPLLWLSAGESPWQACSIIAGVAAAAQATYSSVLFIRPGPGVSRPLTSIFVVGGVISTTVLFLNSAGIGFEKSFTGYLVGLLWIIMASAVFFVRLVYLNFLSNLDE